MALPPFQPSDLPWHSEDGSIVSPLVDGHWEQLALSSTDLGSDYSIDLEIMPLRGEERDGVLYNTAGIVLRYTDKNHYYYAGIGGFGAAFFVGLVEPRGDRPVWSSLALQGKREEIQFNKTYRIRAECQGAQITLVAGDRARISVTDSTHPSGSWGLRTVRTEARFDAIKTGSPSTPKCFVVMPFTTSLYFVYSVIKREVKDAGLLCHRVDESAIAQPIEQEISQDILDADLVIADLTGRNPNVYYEAGIAHALGKPLILIAQSTEDLAFNLRHIRAVVYKNPKELRRLLANAIQDTFWNLRRP